jgi:uncharacterized cupredoxin-like copper-binding protein
MMAASVSPLIDSPDNSTRELSTPDESSSAQDRRIQELEDRLDRQAVSRDAWTLTMFAFSAAALLAGLFGVGLGVRAVSESERNIKTAAAPTAAAPPRVDLSEFKVGLAAATFAPGQHTVVIANSGTVAHELLVFRSDLAPSAYPVDAAGNIIEESPGITKVSDGDNIDPGRSQNRIIDLTTPGKYLFVCNLPGHFKAGMFTQVTVG